MSIESIYESRRLNMTELKCDYCDRLIGWVHEFDLSGSAFQCFKCKEDLEMKNVK